MQAADFSVFRVAKVPSGFESALAIAGEYDGDALSGVIIAVAHAGPEKDNAVVEQTRTVAFLVGFELGQQRVEFLHVPKTDFEQVVEIGATEVAEEV